MRALGFVLIEDTIDANELVVLSMFNKSSSDVLFYMHQRISKLSSSLYTRLTLKLKYYNNSKPFGEEVSNADKVIYPSDTSLHDVTVPYPGVQWKRFDHRNYHQEGDRRIGKKSKTFILDGTEYIGPEKSDKKWPSLLPVDAMFINHLYRKPTGVPPLNLTKMEDEYKPPHLTDGNRISDPYCEDAESLCKLWSREPFNYCQNYLEARYIVCPESCKTCGSYERFRYINAVHRTLTYQDVSEMDLPLCEDEMRATRMYMCHSETSSLMCLDRQFSFVCKRRCGLCPENSRISCAYIMEAPHDIIHDHFRYNFRCQIAKLIHNCSEAYQLLYVNPLTDCTFSCRAQCARDDPLELLRLIPTPNNYNTFSINQRALTPDIYVNIQGKLIPLLPTSTPKGEASNEMDSTEKDNIKQKNKSKIIGDGDRIKIRIGGRRSQKDSKEANE
ncbi:hypothetical protein AB6A40_005495 [Gnathostoma spinigerum]|uniref:ShKT domain-containing protein n=1 Tax=Gnathostoma spinigerum TaxID=75299 RepID=A0ABD6EGF4_9BILA